MKTVLFQIMRTFRWLVVPILKVLSGLFCIFMLVALFADDPKLSGIGIALLWFAFALGFGSLSWYYDALMKKLSPVKQNNQKWS
jgi:hypothetical protein